MAARPTPPRPRLPAACLAVALAAGPAVAQDAAPEQPTAASAAAPDEGYEGRPIRSVRFERPLGVDESGAARFEPLTGASLQRALNNVRSSAGAPYRGELVRDDVNRLNRLNAFARVESLVQPLDDGSVDLIFALEPQRLIVDLQVTGNKQLSDQKIQAEVDVLVGTPIDRFQIDRAARRIEDLYRDRGYYLAEVSVDEDALRESAIVLFRIREGQRIKITDIRFEGATAFTAARLRREIDTVRAGIFRRGSIDDLRLDADAGALVEFYRNEGYLDVRTDRILRPSPDGREAILEFVIDEGPLYTFRDLVVTYRGEEEPGFDRVMSPEQISGFLELKPGGVYSVRDVERAVEQVEAAYKTMGYADVQVERGELRDPGSPLVDLGLRITPGPRYFLGEIRVAGNDLTRAKVVFRELELSPGRPLDQTRLDLSEINIRRVRIFNDRRLEQTLQRPDPADPRYRDVLFEVEETNTGSLDLGAAVNSDAGLIGRIALTQRNFDVADTPDSIGELLTGRAFRGAGQTFSIDLAPGDEIETYSISLADPALFDTDLTGSASLFFRSRDFDEFDEERFGGRFTLGRRFGTQWNGRLNLRAESVELDDISIFRPIEILRLAGQTNELVGVGASLTRNTLDNLFLPTRGSVLDLGFETVMGDFDFNRFNVEHRAFIPLVRDYFGRTTTVSFQTQIGYIPEDEDEVPVFERLYLGGQSFRGFEFRTISPRGTTIFGTPSDDPVGGTWLFFAGAEIRQPLFSDIIAVAGFIDTGTVTFEPGFENYRVSVGVGLRLSVPQLTPAPIAFDFGFPILKEDTDEERLFTFSIDLPF